MSDKPDMLLCALPTRIIALIFVLSTSVAWANPPKAAVVNDAQGAQEQAGLVRRVVRKFDFEERARGNFETMPRHWYRVQGLNYPDYTHMGMDGTVAFGGNTSFKLRLNGGSAAAVLEAGVIAAVPDARYLVRTAVRTADARHSRVRIVGVLLDQYGRFLEQTLTTSPLTISNDGWSTVELQLPPAPDVAAWMILRLELLQPNAYRQAMLGAHELAEQDIRAAAWFDEITVFQLPRISLKSQTPTNVVRRPDSPRLSVSVQDLTGQALTATVTVRDDAGRLIDQDERRVQDASSGLWTWQPKLPELGWYWANLTVRSEQGVVGRADLGLAWLPQVDGRGERERHRFQIIAEHMDQTERKLLSPMLDKIGATAVQLGLWHANMTPEELSRSVAGTDPLIAELVAEGRQVSLAIPAVPRNLAISVGTDTDKPLDMLARDPSVWRSYLQALLALYGQSVQRWQIGASGSSEAFWREDLQPLYDSIMAEFRRYIADPELVLPWSAQHVTAHAPADLKRLMVDVPVSIRPRQFESYAETWKRDPADLTHHLRTLPVGTYSSADRGADLALRMIHSWLTGVGGVAIRHPWSSADGQLWPDPLLPVWAHVSHQLAGRRFIGTMHLGPDIVTHLLDGPAGGVLVVWNEGSDQSKAQLDLYLGDQPRAVDIYGNSWPITRVEDRQQFAVTQSPLFIEGVDMRLARLRAGFQLEPAFVPSTHSRHEHQLRLENPFPRTITGRLRITGPKRWNIQPRLANFSIPAGQVLELPVSFSFPINELAGPKRITAEVELEADKRYQLALAAPAEVGLKDVLVQSNLAVETTADGTRDVVVTLMVTNSGDVDRSFFAFAQAPGVPRQERIISPLKAGQTTMKRFRMVDAADQLSGADVHVGLRQADGPAVLNHMLQVP